MNKTVIDERIHTAIRPQLERADELLDHYLRDAPADVWEPIAFKVGSDHYGTEPFPPIIGSFAAHVTDLDKAIRTFMNVIESPAMTADLMETP